LGFGHDLADPRLEPGEEQFLRRQLNMVGVVVYA
jgi:hypothetical protein